MSRFSQRKISTDFTIFLSIFLIVGLLIVPTMGLIGGLLIGLIVALIDALIGGFKTDLKIRSGPNQGIKASVKNISALALIGLILWGLVQIKLMPYLQEFMTPTQFQIFPVLNATTIMIFIIWCGGGRAFSQHVSLRVTLYLSHQKPNDRQTRCIPWNYARFLSYAADRKLLQQTGGTYRFIHRSLLEHFAKMGETGSP